MRAVPDLVGTVRRPGPAEMLPPVAPEPPEPSRPDDPTLLYDIDAMQRRLETASPDEVAQYVETLRRSEGIAPPAAAPVWQPVYQQQVPVFQQAPVHQPQPAPEFPPVGWRPGAPSWNGAPAPVYAPPPAQMQTAPSSIPPASVPVPSKRKSSRAGGAAVFVAMFLATMAGVGALTYVALRSGHFSHRGAVTTHAVD